MMINQLIMSIPLVENKICWLSWLTYLANLNLAFVSMQKRITGFRDCVVKEEQ